MRNLHKFTALTLLLALLSDSRTLLTNSSLSTFEQFDIWSGPCHTGISAQRSISIKRPLFKTRKARSIDISSNAQFP